MFSVTVVDSGDSTVPAAVPVPACSHCTVSCTVGFDVFVNFRLLRFLGSRLTACIATKGASYQLSRVEDGRRSGRYHCLACRAGLPRPATAARTPYGRSRSVRLFRAVSRHHRCHDS